MPATTAGIFSHKNVPALISTSSPNFASIVVVLFLMYSSIDNINNEKPYCGLSLKLSFPLNDSKIAIPSFNAKLRYSARVAGMRTTTRLSDFIYQLSTVQFW